MTHLYRKETRFERGPTLYEWRASHIVKELRVGWDGMGPPSPENSGSSKKLRQHWRTSTSSTTPENQRITMRQTQIEKLTSLRKINNHIVAHTGNQHVWWPIWHEDSSLKRSNPVAEQMSETNLVC